MNRTDQQSETAGVPLIRLRGLTKLYRMGDAIVRALDGVDLDIDRGEFVAITGPSGSGKSTIMHMIGCLDRPTAGTYLLEGRDVSRLSDRELARIRNRSIGFVFQTFNLINRTSALDNVGIPLFYARQVETRGPARRALERVGLGSRARHTPAELSGGERQRVAIARAIVNNPAVVLADEPTGNLDSRTGQQIIDIFRSLNEQGVTVVLVTHEREVALQAKRIVQMRDGKIVADQSTAEFQRGPALPAADGSPWEPAAEPGDAGAPVVARRAAASTAELPPATLAGLKGRVAAGANGAFACGIAAPLFLLLWFVTAAVAGRMKVDLSRLQPGELPPTGFLVLLLIAAGCFLFALVAGAIGVFWGRAVLRRIRAGPEQWLGKGRARIGWICGLVTILVPVAQIGYAVVRWMLRAGA